MATVTPLKLLQELQAAQRRGGHADYYGVGAALGGIGDAWDKMNASIRSGVQTENAVRQRDIEQEIGDAFKRARAEGHEIGSPELSLAMQKHITSYGGAKGTATSVQAAQRQLRADDFQIAAVKQAAEKQLLRSMARNLYQQYLDTGAFEQTPTGNSMEEKEAAMRAWRDARAKLKDNGVTVRIDPRTRQIIAVDANGQGVQLDPGVLGVALEADGDKNAKTALASMHAMFGDNLKAAIAEAKAIAAKNVVPQAPKAVPAPKEDPYEHRYFVARGKQYAEARKAYNEAKKVGTEEEAQAAAKRAFEQLQPYVDEFKPRAATPVDQGLGIAPTAELAPGGMNFGVDYSEAPPPGPNFPSPEEIPQ